MFTEEVILEPTPSDPVVFPMDIYNPAGYVLPRSYREHYKQVLEQQVRDDDVWIVSHPKCGTTWTIEMVWLLRHNHDYDAAQELLEERVPFFEHTPVLLNRMSEEEREVLLKTQPLRFTNSFLKVAELPGPRTIKTHLHWNLLPRDLRRPDSKAKIIYVSREPKDACISYYHHYRLLYKYTGSFEEYAEIFLADKLLYGPFWKHLLEFWEMKDKQNVLFLRYEDMIKDLPLVLREVNDFLNLSPLSNDQIEKLNHHLSFSNMKKNIAVNTTFSARPESNDIDEGDESQFLRKGIVGDWKGKMSLEMARRFNEWSVKQTRGYEFSY